MGQRRESRKKKCNNNNNNNKEGERESHHDERSLNGKLREIQKKEMSKESERDQERETKKKRARKRESKKERASTRDQEIATNRQTGRPDRDTATSPTSRRPLHTSSPRSRRCSFMLREQSRLLFSCSKVCSRPGVRSPEVQRKAKQVLRFSSVCV